MAEGLLPNCPICNRKIRRRWKGLASLLFAKDKGIFTGLGAFLRTNLKYIIALPADTQRIVLSTHTGVQKKYSGNCFKDLFCKLHSNSSPRENLLNYSNDMKLQISPISLKATKVQWKLTQQKIMAQTILCHKHPSPHICGCFTKIWWTRTHTAGVNLERQEKTFQAASHTAIAAGATKNGTAQIEEGKYSVQQSSGQEKNSLTT